MAVPLVVLGAALLAAAARADESVVWGVGGRARLLCAVEGAPAPRRPPPPLDASAPADAAQPLPHAPYTWRYHGKEIPSKKVSPDGSLEVWQRSDAEGVYQCEVLALPGRLLSYPVHLRFPSMEEQFEVQPSNNSALSRQPLALSCRIRSTPPAALLWLKDGRTLTNHYRYHFLENDLLITDVRDEDAGLYRCQAKNDHVNKIYESAPALVVVSVPVATPPALVVLETKPNVTVEVGKPATLACPVRGWPRPKVYWELNLPSDRTRRLDSTEEVLTINSATVEDSGVYTCRIEGRPDLYKNFTLNVWERVRVLHPPTSKQVQRASTVRLNCTAEGAPRPATRWYKDGRPLNITGPIKLMKSSKTQLIELVISGATSKDAGTYQCFADNGHSVASAWAQLNVTGGDTAEPVGVRCAPVGVRTVRVRWQHKDPANVVAYTVHYSPRDGGVELTGPPDEEMAQNLTVQMPLVPYTFKVRAYRTDSASDLSEPVECQGQGVPVDVRRKGGRVKVSWAQFAKQTRAAQWVLQVRKPTNDIVNVTLSANTTSYELDVPTEEKWFVRLLGSRDLEWLSQDLTLVPWTSTPEADQNNNRNTAPSVPEVVRVWPRGALIMWHYAEENMLGHHVYTICIRTSGRLDENCQQTSNNTAKIEDLQPNTEYEVRVQAMTMGSGGAFSQPFLIVTPSEDPQRFREVHYTPVNASSVRVWWRAADAELGPQLYTVRYSPKLTLPVHEWSALNVTTNDALVPLGDNQRVYVIVMAYEPAENSLVLTITRPNTGRTTGLKSLKNIKYEYTDDGLSIRWSDSAGAVADKMYSVRYSHNITMPIESWTERNVSRAQLYNYHVTNVPDGAWTYVVVSPLGDARETHMLNVPPPPTRMHRAMLLGVSMGVVVCAVCAGAGALCMWRRRRKRRRTTHRRGTSTNDSIEDGSEMKRQGMGSGEGAAGAANGGARGAGEPLLNGHVRITENPALSKTPNGKLKKQRRPNFDAFDFSRRDMEETHTPPMATLMDTSRPPEPYGKLPDDNMNSELGDSPTPTLQPNG